MSLLLMSSGSLWMTVQYLSDISLSRHPPPPDFHVAPMTESAGNTPTTRTQAEKEDTAADAGENGITPTLKSNTISMTTKSKKKATLLTKIQTHRSSTPSRFIRTFGQHLTQNPSRHLRYRHWTTRAFIVTPTYRELGQVVPNAVLVHGGASLVREEGTHMYM